MYLYVIESGVTVGQPFERWSDWQIIERSGEGGAWLLICKSWFPPRISRRVSWCVMRRLESQADMHDARVHREYQKVLFRQVGVNQERGEKFWQVRAHTLGNFLNSKKNSDWVGRWVGTRQADGEEVWTDVGCVIKHGPLPLSHAFLLPLK